MLILVDYYYHEKKEWKKKLMNYTWINIAHCY